MIEKYLLKFCATEVQLMITRLQERPQDFKHGTVWRGIITTEHSAFTKIEAKVVAAYWRKHKQSERRQELLGGIMAQTINPTSKEEWEDGPMGSKRTGTLMGATTVIDPRAMYGQNAHTMYGQNAHPSAHLAHLNAQLDAHQNAILNTHQKAMQATQQRNGTYK